MTFTEAINEIVTKLTTLKTNINTFLTNRGVTNVSTLTQVPAALYNIKPQYAVFEGTAHKEDWEWDYVTLTAYGYSINGTDVGLFKVGNSDHLRIDVLSDINKRCWGDYNRDTSCRVLIQNPRVIAGTNLSIGTVNTTHDASKGEAINGDNLQNGSPTEKWYTFDIEGAAILNNADTAQGSVVFDVKLQKNRSTVSGGNLTLTIPFTVHK